MQSLTLSGHREVLAWGTTHEQIHRAMCGHQRPSTQRRGIAFVDWDIGKSCAKNIRRTVQQEDRLAREEAIEVDAD